MENHNSQDNSRLRQILWYRLIWIMVGFGILVVLILILMPFGMDYGIERYFLANGADQTNVEDVDFNPFTRRLVVKNLVVKLGAEQVLNVSEANFTLSWSPFFKKRFVLEKIELTDSNITIEELPDGRWLIGGLSPATSAEQTTASQWSLGLNELQIKNSQVKFRNAQLTSELKIEEARLTRLRSWLPNQNARIEFKGQLNDGKLQFQGDFSPFGENTIVDGSMKLQELTLTPFAQLIAADPASLQGRLEADVKIRIISGFEKGFSFDQKGRVALHQIKSRFGSVTLTDEDLLWYGTVQVKAPNTTDELQIEASGQLEGKGGSVNPTPENLMFQHGGLNWNGKFVLARKPETADFIVNGELKLREYKMGSADLDLEEKSLAWDGNVQIKLPSSADALSITATGQMDTKGSFLDSTSQNFKLQDSGLNWNGKFAFAQKQETTDLNIDGELKLGGLEMATSNVNLAEESLSWDGSVRITIPSSPKALTITAAGKMAGKGTSLDSPPANFKLQSSNMNWNGEFALGAKEKTTDVKLDGDLKFAKLEVASADMLLAEEGLRWNGGIQVLLPEDAAGQRLTTNGKFESRRQMIALHQEKLNVTNEDLSWKGRFNCGLKDFTAGLAADVDFSLTDLAITDSQKKIGLLASKAVNLKSIKGDAKTQFSIATAKITGLDLVGQTGSPEKASLFSAAEVQADTIKLEQLKQVSIESARIVTARGILHHKSNGRWRYIEDLTTYLTDYGTGAQKKSSQNRAAEKTRPPAKVEGVEFGIRIGSLEIAGDSVLHFKDETVSPAFVTKVALKKVLLTGVNSFKPEQSSPFTLEASSRKYTRLKLQGSVQPFGERISMDLNGKIRALEMPPLSPYAVKTIGYNLISGEMDADIDLKITVGKLEGEGDLKFNNPIVEAVNPEKLENAAGSPIPLQSALKVLRDKKDDVRLKTPISGDVTDPKFSIADAINQAVIKGLTMATLSYLKYMLGPYGTAIAIVELGAKVGAKTLTGIRLKPVEFQPGTSDLDAIAQEYMDKLAAILKQKEDLRVRLCGWATVSDRMGSSKAAAGTPGASSPAVSPDTKSATDGQSSAQKDARFPLSEEAMLALAEQRADLIEEILVSRHGIQDDRIFICKPEIDKSPEAKPRVELVF